MFPFSVHFILVTTFGFEVSFYYEDKNVTFFKVTLILFAQILFPSTFVNLNH